MIDANKATDIRTLSDIGKKLRNARGSDSPETVAKQLPPRKRKKNGTVVYESPSGMQYRRWEDGTSEGGCRQIAIAGRILGISPNELFLNDAVKEESLDPEDESRLSKISRGLRVLRFYSQKATNVNVLTVAQSTVESLILEFGLKDKLKRRRVPKLNVETGLGKLHEAAKEAERKSS